jgi:hypothetical protein
MISMIQKSFVLFVPYCFYWLLAPILGTLRTLGTLGTNNSVIKNEFLEVPFGKSSDTDNYRLSNNIVQLFHCLTTPIP